MCGTIFAQSSVITVDYNKLPTTAVTNNFTGDIKVVEAAIENRMKTYQSKGKKKNGFIVYEAVQIPEISQMSVDVYYKVSKKGKNNSTVIMLVSSGNENFFKEEENTSEIENSRAFLNGLTTNIDEELLKIEIDEKAKMVKAADKALNKKRNELKKLENQKKSIESKISKTQKEIEEAERNLQAQESEKKELQSQQ
jgi:chromosome segregation ATPase